MDTTTQQENVADDSLHTFEGHTGVYARTAVSMTLWRSAGPDAPATHVPYRCSVLCGLEPCAHRPSVHWQWR